MRSSALLSTLCGILWAVIIVESAVPVDKPLDQWDKWEVAEWVGSLGLGMTLWMPAGLTCNARH